MNKDIEEELKGIQVRDNVKFEGKKYTLDPYGFEMGVAICPEMKPMGSVYGYGSMCWLCVPEDRPDLPTLVHECLHVLDELERFLGDTLEREARAYIVQSIFEKCLNAFGVSGEEPVKTDIDG